MKKNKAAALIAAAGILMQPAAMGAQTLSVPYVIESGPVTSESRPVIAFEEESNPGQIVQGEGVGMYRLYNPNSGEHFYTKDDNEKAYLARAGWTLEGIGWNAPEISDIPVYRLYNENAGDHHYTSDAEEKQKLVDLGWKDEGIGWYSADESGFPVFRQYNPNAKTGAHNYTPDPKEDAALGELGWNLEGVGWYALNFNAPAANVAQDLESRLVGLEMNMRTANANDLALEGLEEQGWQINTLLDALASYGDRYYAFQSGKLVGYSAEGSDRVQIPEKTEGAILVVQPKDKKIERAESVKDEAFEGLASAFGGDVEQSEFKAVCGSMENGAFEGIAISYEAAFDGDDYFEEMSSGMSRANVMDGTIERHTHHFGGEQLDYRWKMETENGKAAYTKDGDRYILYQDPDLVVYYYFEPVNLHFWTEKWDGFEA